MKKIVLFPLFLVVALACSVHAYGSYSNDQLNTTNTEQNITFNVTPYTEIVWVSVPRNVNITSGEWVLTGYQPGNGLEYQENLTSVNCSVGWDAIESCSKLYDSDWSTSGKSTGAGVTVDFFANYTKPANASGATWQVKEEVYHTNKSIPTTCWDNGDVLQLHIRIVRVVNSGDVLMRCMNTTNDWQTISYTSTILWNYQIYEEAIWWNLSYPENVTIDIGNDGVLDYINWTEFNTNETITFNATGIEAINNFLRNETLCSGDFETATCDVPFNISSVTAGILQISNISISGEFIYGVFNVTVFDEMIGDPYFFAGAIPMILTFFCDNETQNVTVVSEGQEVNVLCEVEEVRITVEEAGTTDVIRYLVPASDQEDLHFYVYNSSEETDVSQDWLYFDVTGLYENGIVIVTKVIIDVGERVMIEKIIDSESKTTLYLVVGERYCVSVFDSNRGNERALGCMDADADAEKRISISTIPFSPDQAIPYEDVFIAFSWNKTAEIIQGMYNDTLDQTNNVTMVVYNASNSSQIMFSSSTTSSVVTFTYNNVDVNGTYVARIIAEHNVYGIIDPMVTIDFGGKFKVAGLEDLGLGIYMSIAGGMVSMLVMLAFGKRFAKMGSAVFVFMVLLFMQWGWFDASPQIGWGMLTLVAFVVFGNVITLKRRLQ